MHTCASLCLFYIYIIISLIRRCQWPSHWTGLAWGPVRTHPLAHYAFRTGVTECPPHHPPTRTCHTHTHTYTYVRTLAQTSPLIKLMNTKACTQPEYCRPFLDSSQSDLFFSLSLNVVQSRASTTVLLLQAWPREPRFSPPYKARKVLKKGVKRTPRPLHRSCVLYCYE